jgi:hypothetical protein
MGAHACCFAYDHKSDDELKSGETMRINIGSLVAALAVIFTAPASAQAPGKWAQVGMLTCDGLRDELEIQERLDAAINRCLKQLLMVRGVKSVTAAPPSPAKRITDRSKAA